MLVGACKQKAISMEAIKQTGYDFVEVNISSLESISDEEFAKMKANLRTVGLKVYSANCFFPSGISLYNDEIWNYLDGYLRKIGERGKELGIKIFVLGSGRQRSYPTNISKEEAIDRFVKIVGYCTEILDTYGIKLAIEPLRYEETNLINTVLEGAEIAKLVNNKSCGVLVDFFHFHMNGEDLDTLNDVKDYLIHAHIARPDPSRLQPIKENLPILKKWKAKLDEIGYDKTISLECKEIGVNEIVETKQYLDIFK